jgi:SHS2 domain-containing protein
MEKYVILPHTADAKFQAFGATLEEAFGNAALALASLMWDWEKVARTVSFPAAVRGKDLEQLVVRFLGEIIFLLEKENFLLAAVEGLRIEERDNAFHLSAEFLGGRLQEGYDIFSEVKAITYNELKIEKDGHFTVQVVVDM